MARRPFFGQNDTKIAKMDMQAATAPGRAYASAFESLGNIAAYTLEKFREKKEEKEREDNFERMAKKLPSEVFSAFGVQSEEEKSDFIKSIKKKGPREDAMAVMSFYQKAQDAQDARDVRNLQMDQLRRNMERQKDADLLANEDRMSENQFMQSLMSQTASPQAQRQADIAMPGLAALGNGDARNRFMEFQLQDPRNQVPVSSLGSQDFGRFASRAGLDPKLSVARMEALRQAELASQPKPMTPKELADYEAKLIANETNRIKLNELQNPPAPPAPPEPVYIEAALDAIDDAITLVGKDSIFNPTAGFGSETAKSIGGSDAADLEAALSTITSAVGFKRLQDMREASPTGGALGSVSERELSQLNAALGSISQKQSPEQLKKNLLKIKDHYQKAVDAINAQRIAYNSGLTFKTQEEALKYIQSQKSSNAIKTDQGDYSIEGLSVEAQ